MTEIDKFEFLVLGSGEAGKYLAWTMAQAGHRTAVVERRWIGGSCPNIACLPSKDVIWSAKVASLSGRGPEFGLPSASTVDMAAVRRRKRKMVEDMVNVHLDRYKQSNVQLIMGEGRFVGPKRLEVKTNDGTVRLVEGDRVFLNVGTHAAQRGDTRGNTRYSRLEGCQSTDPYRSARVGPDPRPPDRSRGRLHRVRTFASDAKVR